LVSRACELYLVAFSRITFRRDLTAWGKNAIRRDRNDATRMQDSRAGRVRGIDSLDGHRDRI